MAQQRLLKGQGGPQAARRQRRRASGRSPRRRCFAPPGLRPGSRGGQGAAAAAKDYEKSEERNLKKLIETEHISFSYEEETGLPLVL